MSPGPPILLWLLTPSDPCTSDRIRATTAPRRGSNLINHVTTGVGLSPPVTKHCSMRHSFKVRVSLYPSSWSLCAVSFFIVSSLCSVVLCCGLPDVDLYAHVITTPGILNVPSFILCFPLSIARYFLSSELKSVCTILFCGHVCQQMSVQSKDRC